MRADVFLDPGQGSRIKYLAAWIPSATATAVGKSGGVRRSGGLVLRTRPPATVRATSGGFRAASRHPCMNPQIATPA